MTTPVPARDDRTGRGYPLPHPENTLEADVERIRESVRKIDVDISDLEVLMLALGN